MTTPVLRVGVAGLGRAFTLMLPTFLGDARVRLVAATDPRQEARERFVHDFDARTYSTVEGLCADPAVEVVYIATPHQYHAAHATCAARAGKHALVEKPMAVTLDEAQQMVDAAERAGTVLIIGHSHSFDRPIASACAIIASGSVGRLKMITALNFTDYMFRPRRPEELATAVGGGVLFSQAAHQVDIVRLLGGGRVTRVRAAAGSWDPARPTEGAYAALLLFEDGACASLTYSGYGHFDSDELSGWTSEMGFAKDPAQHGAARRALTTAQTSAAEASLKNARNYGGSHYNAPAVAVARPSIAPAHQHFGFILASCEHADLRPLPTGVMIYGDSSVRLDPLPPPAVPRAEVIDELVAAIHMQQPALHSGRWGLATLETCLALLDSAREQREIALSHQIAAAPGARGP